MAVKARFYVQATKRTAASGGTEHGLEVTLFPVVRPTNDNVEWSKYTPSGSITLNVTAAGAQEWFEERLSKDVSITFADVDEE